MSMYCPILTIIVIIAFETKKKMKKKKKKITNEVNLKFDKIETQVQDKR